MYTWGSGNKYQLGHGDKKDCVSPRLVHALQHMLIQQITCGGDSSGVLTGKASQAEVMQDLSNRISMVENAEVSIWIGI